MTRLLVTTLVVLSGCTLPAVMPEALNTEYKPTGEVNLHDRSASFDAVRVRSVAMNLARRTDGSWGGTFLERPIDVSVTDKAIRGVDFTFTREGSLADKLVITGQFNGRIYRFELDSTHVVIRSPTSSQTLVGRVVKEGITAYGPQGDLMLKGEAGSELPPWPQLAFALVSAFN
jgi:hypothetical protein